jgi:hypothetical protein
VCAGGHAQRYAAAITRDMLQAVRGQRHSSFNRCYAESSDHGTLLPCLCAHSAGVGSADGPEGSPVAVVTQSCSPANSVQPVQCGGDPASFLQGFTAARLVPSLHASYPHDASQVSAHPFSRSAGQWWPRSNTQRRSVGISVVDEMPCSST